MGAAPSGEGGGGGEGETTTLGPTTLQGSGNSGGGGGSGTTAASGPRYAGESANYGYSLTPAVSWAGAKAECAKKEAVLAYFPSAEELSVAKAIAGTRIVYDVH